MRVCLIWKLHQPNSWHPRLGRYLLPWTRIQILRSYQPLLQLALEPGSLPFTIAASPDLLEFLEHCSLQGQRDTLLELHRKPAEQLRPNEVDELLSFAFEAASEQLVAPFPRYAELYARWRAVRGNLKRTREALSTGDLQDLQVLAPLAWLSPELQQQTGEVLARARSGQSFEVNHAVEVAEVHWQQILEFHARLKEVCKSGEVEYLGGALHQALLPMLADSSPEFRYPEDGRAHIVRGPRVHYRNFALWPTVLHLTEGALSSETSQLMAQSCLDWAVASSRVLDRSLQRKATPEELTSCWNHRGRAFRFSSADLSGLFRNVYPALAPEVAFADFKRRLRELGEGTDDPDAMLLVELDPALDAHADAARSVALWRLLLHQLPKDLPVAGGRLDALFSASSGRSLANVTPYTERSRGFARWSPESRPLYWQLLRHSRRQFQNVRAWKTLSPSALTSARDSLLLLQSKDWVDCMETGLDPWTRRRTEELLRSHFENVYRTLEVEIPPELSQPMYVLETRITSIGPSRDISPVMDGQRSSYSSWNGSGFFRARETDMGGWDSWRQISELYFGADGVYVYLRAALPLAAREMLEQFELQGVLHAAEGEQTVTWFLVRLRNGETQLTTRLAVPIAAREEEQPRAVVGEVVDLRIPLSALGVRLGEVLRLQVSLWEHGNAVASAPPLGWEEFEVGDALYREEVLAAPATPDYWGGTAVG